MINFKTTASLFVLINFLAVTDSFAMKDEDHQEPPVTIVLHAKKPADEKVETASPQPNSVPSTNEAEALRLENANLRAELEAARTANNAPSQPVTSPAVTTVTNAAETTQPKAAKAPAAKEVNKTAEKKAPPKKKTIAHKVGKEGAQAAGVVVGATNKAIKDGKKGAKKGYKKGLKKGKEAIKKL